MFQILVCHAAADRSVALLISRRLALGSEALVEREECGLVTEALEGGVTCDAILLLLSPDAVPDKRTREAWEPVLAHSEPPMAAVMVRSCLYPKLLERRSFFRLIESGRGSEGGRGIELWVNGLRGWPENVSFEPAPGPKFEGREEELDRLSEALVDGAGTAVSTRVNALEFVGRASGHFRSVLWLECRDRSRIMLLGDLAWRLGVAVQGTYEEAMGRLEGTLRERRLLLVFAGAAEGAPITAPREGRTSVLIATPEDDPAPPVKVEELAAAFAGWRRERDKCIALVPHLERALSSGSKLAADLGERAGAFFKEERRWWEAEAVYERLHEAAMDRDDVELAERCAWELAWIQGREGEIRRPVEAGEQLGFEFE